METESFIKARQEGGVGWLLLDRPAKANAYTDAMIAQMAATLDRFNSEGRIRALIIASAAPGPFCAGADLDEIRARRAEDAFTIPSMALFDQLEALPFPVIAAVGGAAIAGGCELTLACDVRIASERARFGLPEVGLGILPAAGATWRLPRLVGHQMAREIILLGRVLNAHEALAAGLVSEVVAHDQLLERAREAARRAEQFPPAALAAAKEALNRTLGATGREFVQQSQARFYAEKREKAK